MQCNIWTKLRLFLNESSKRELNHLTECRDNATETRELSQLNSRQVIAKREVYKVHFLVI